MTIYISRDDSCALEHHGVKGMKWGVRNDRYQNLKTSAKVMAIRYAPTVATAVTRNVAKEAGYAAITSMIAGGYSNAALTAVSLNPYMAIGAGIVAGMMTKKAIQAYNERKYSSGARRMKAR